MSQNIKQFINGLGLKPVSADPSSPVQGQLQYADGTIRAEGLWRYDGTAWQQVGSGAGSYDIFYQENLETNSSSNFTTGQNATPDAAGTGTLGGTLADEESSQISGDRSLKYTMNATASSSDNDFFLNDTDIALDAKQKGQFIGISFYYTYNGDDDDIRFFMLDQDDNELTQSDEYIKSKSTATRFSTSVFVPSSNTAIRYGFQVVTGNSSKVFIVDDIEFSTNPFVYKEIQPENTFTASIDSAGTLSSENVDGTFSTSRPSTGTYSVDYTSLGLSENPVLQVTINGGTALGHRIESISSTSATVVLRNSSNTTANDSFSVTLVKQGADYQAPAEHVVTPAKAVFEKVRYSDRPAGASGYGSTNLAIPVFTTEEENTTGDLISISNSATLGFSITALKRVIVFAEWHSSGLSSSKEATTGFSLNSSQLSNNVRTINTSDIVSLDLSHDDGGNSTLLCGTTAIIELQPGDVLRPHGDGNSHTYTAAGISVTAQAAEAQFLAAVPMNYTQTKVYNGTAANNAVMLQFNNLVIGKLYRVKGQVYGTGTTSGAGGAEIEHDGNVLARIYYNSSSSASDTALAAMGDAIFKATTTTVEFRADVPSGIAILGDGTRNRTWLEIEELNYTKETTRFT
jgi:hypothetical protein